MENQSVIPGYGARADEDQVTQLLGERGGFLGGGGLDRHGCPLHAKCSAPRAPGPAVLRSSVCSEPFCRAAVGRIRPSSEDSAADPARVRGGCPHGTKAGVSTQVVRARRGRQGTCVM